MSKRRFHLGQISLMTRGPKFCPTKNGNFLEIKSDTSAFTRKLKLMETFHDKDFQDTSIVKDKSSYEPDIKNKSLTEIINKIEHTDPLLVKYKDNLRPIERAALEELKTYNDIIIKKANKGIHSL